MVDLNDLKISKFLKREDVGTGVVVTIEGLTKENVAREGDEDNFKWILHLKELDKPLILNSTNGQLIGKITGVTNEIEKNWIGKKIVLYDDPAVSFGGKLVGGIRIRQIVKGDQIPF